MLLVRGKKYKDGVPAVIGSPLVALDLYIPKSPFARFVDAKPQLFEPPPFILKVAISALVIKIPSPLATFTSNF